MFSSVSKAISRCEIQALPFTLEQDQDLEIVETGNLYTIYCREIKKFMKLLSKYNMETKL